MDRDKALRQAIINARVSGHIHVIHRYANADGWYIQDYYSMELLEATDIRYVLPNGEVCKLS